MLRNLERMESFGTVNGFPSFKRVILGYLFPALNSKKNLLQYFAMTLRIMMIFDQMSYIAT